MADFNIELTVKMVPEFKCSKEELITFLKLVKNLYDKLKTYLDFIVNVKLNTLVRTALGGT